MPSKQQKQTRTDNVGSQGKCHNLQYKITNKTSTPIGVKQSKPHRHRDDKRVMYNRMHKPGRADQTNEKKTRRVRLADCTCLRRKALCSAPPHPFGQALNASKNFSRESGADHLTGSPPKSFSWSSLSAAFGACSSSSIRFTLALLRMLKTMGMRTYRGLWAEYQKKLIHDQLFDGIYRFVNSLSKGCQHPAFYEALFCVDQNQIKQP